MKVLKRVRRVFMRSGDNTSSFDYSVLRFKLFDGTELGINLSYTSWKLPKAVKQWYISIWSNDRNGKHASDWLVTDKNNIRRILLHTFSQRNKLSGIRYKEREKMIKRCLKS